MIDRQKLLMGMRNYRETETVETTEKEQLDMYIKLLEQRKRE